MEFHDIVIQQKSYFDSNSTKSIAFRKIMLKKLMDALDEREDLLLEALHKDLGKSRGEGYMTEVGMVRYRQCRKYRNGRCSFKLCPGPPRKSLRLMA